MAPAPHIHHSSPSLGSSSGSVLRCSRIQIKIRPAVRPDMIYGSSPSYTPLESYLGIHDPGSYLEAPGSKSGSYKNRWAQQSGTIWYDDSSPYKNLARLLGHTVYLTRAFPSDLHPKLDGRSAIGSGLRISLMQDPSRLSHIHTCNRIRIQVRNSHQCFTLSYYGLNIYFL